ncbi:MAG TPA: hypothetical protein VFC82_04255 [Actinomycetaceae bacterium]|nr:hypothetical protein [Actinomycetaceae bacterium]
MSTLLATLSGVFHVFVTSIVFGVGLPAVFALGMRAHAWGSGTTRKHDGAEELPPSRRFVGNALMVACLSVVMLGLVIGIGVILSSGLGMELTFNGVIPVLAPKG